MLTVYVILAGKDQKINIMGPSSLIIVILVEGVPLQHSSI